MSTIRCPGCRARLTAREGAGGKKLACPLCAAPAQAPGATLGGTNARADTPAAPHLPPAARALRSVLAGYEVQCVLGRGGMGIVYRARQVNLDRTVAIKSVLLDQADEPSLLARFEQEVRAVARLRHPNIVTAHDCCRQSGRLFLIMEYLEGQTLHDWINEHGPLDEPLTWALARQAAAGLAHAAEVGFVHRDVKPANLFLVEPPAGSSLPPGVPLVKVTDFGLALLAADAARDDRLTQAGTVVGTPAYMAPEQFSRAAIDCRADIYALGATVFHMLTGRPPFAGGPWDVMVAKARSNPPWRRVLERAATAASAELVAAMMAPRPEDRPGSYAELLGHIDRLSAPAPRPPRRVGWWAATVALPLLALAAWLAMPAKKPEPPPVRVKVACPLFDGRTVSPPDWTPLSGVWGAAEDAERARVLSGQGCIRRRLPTLARYAVSANVDLHRARAVELHFGIAAPGDRGQPRLVLRAGADGVFLGWRDGDAGALTRLSPVRPFPRSVDPTRSPYRALRAQRHGGRWWAWFDERLIGSAPAAEQTELAEVRLVAEGGPALFEDLVVAELVD